MTSLDLFNGLEDAAKACEEMVPSTTYLGKTGQYMTTPRTHDLRRAVEAVRLAKRLLEGSQLAEEYFCEPEWERKQKVK